MKEGKHESLFPAINEPYRPDNLIGKVHEHHDGADDPLHLDVGKPYTRVVQDIPLGVYTFAGIVVLGKTIGMFAEKTPGSSTLTETTTKTQETTSDSKRTMGKD